MELIGLETIAAELAQPTFVVKCLLSEHAAVFFPATSQHADVRIAGLAYEEESQGNALAATVTPQRFGIRPHARCSVGLVREIVRRLVAREDMQWARSIPVFYGDKNLGS